MTDWVFTNDGKLALDRLGAENAPAVVLLHGGGQTRHSWSGAAERLAMAGYRVINFDARGHGESAWASDGCYTLDRRADDLRAVLGDVRNYALIGASLGGATAIHAVAQGLRPRALVLVDVVPNAEQAGIDRIRRFMLSAPDGFASIEEAAEAVAAYNPDRPRPRDPEGLRRNLRLRDDGRLHWHWDPAILDDDRGAMRNVLAASSRKLVDIAGLKTLLVRGMRSDVVSDATVAAFRQILPSFDVLDVERAGHMVAGDRNDAFNAGVCAYLEKHMPLLAETDR